MIKKKKKDGTLEARMPLNGSILGLWVRDVVSLWVGKRRNLLIFLKFFNYFLPIFLIFFLSLVLQVGGGTCPSRKAQATPLLWVQTCQKQGAAIFGKIT